MKSLIISPLYPCFCRELAEYGYDIIPSKKIEEFAEPEQLHADMQALRINDRLFTLKNCAKKAGEKYPENVLLNCLFIGNTLYGRLDSVDDTVLDYCREEDIKLVNVNQGYTKCSSLQVAENAVITADKSIEKALKNNGAEVLLISPGNIELKGFDYGFIGGAGFYNNGTVYFFGNVKKHPDYDKIKQFCDSYNSDIEILCQDMPLTDIGSAVVLSNNN